MRDSDSTTALVIADIAILQDVQGRYNLNTLHRASEAGNDSGKAPNQWLRRKSTQALIAALEAQTANLPLDVVTGGNRAGTYAHELLAISYAGWISPAFQLRVNQAFLDMKQGHALPALPPEALQALTQVVHALPMLVQAAQGNTLAIQHLAVEQSALMHRIEQLEAAVDNRPGYMTLMGYARLKHFRLTLKEARAYGQQLRTKARQAGVQLGKVPDERWGTVNTYPIELLDELFAPLLQAQQALERQD